MFLAAATDLETCWRPAFWRSLPPHTDEVSMAMIAPILKSRISFKILMIMAWLDDWIICPWKRST